MTPKCDCPECRKERFEEEKLEQKEIKIKKYFAVVKDKAEGMTLNYTKKHETFDEARQEAIRLCRKERCKFHIIELCGIVEEVKPVICPIAYTPAKLTFPITRNEIE